MFVVVAMTKLCLVAVGLWLSTPHESISAQQLTRAARHNNHPPDAWALKSRRTLSRPQHHNDNARTRLCRLLPMGFISVSRKHKSIARLIPLKAFEEARHGKPYKQDNTY